MSGMRDGRAVGRGGVAAVRTGDIVSDDPIFSGRVSTSH